MNYPFRVFSRALCAAGLLAAPAYAGNAPDNKNETARTIGAAALTDSQPYADNVFGDWGGVKSTLADRGVELGASYLGDFWHVASGGNKTGSNYNDLLTVSATLDGEKLWGIAGSKAYVSAINNFGSHVNGSRLGSAEGIDNIEAGADTVKLYEAWVEQQWDEGKWAALFGYHDLNSEFALAPLSANFTKPTAQFGQSFAQSGVNGPSVFPTPGLALRLKYSPTPQSYVMAAAFEGTPGNPARPHGNHFDLTDREGALLIAEAGLTPAVAGEEESPNKFALGAWSYTKNQTDLASGNPQKQEGVYLLTSYAFYRDRAARTLGVFGNLGLADGDAAQVDWDYELGFVGKGWIPSRAEGEWGLLTTRAHNGDTWRDAQTGTANRAEYGFELYYRDTVCPGVTLQPDVHYVVNPGSDATAGNATIVGLRVGLDL